MKISVLSATLVALLMALGSATALVNAQAPAGPNAIAVLDVATIFRSHIRYKNAVERMNTDLKAAEDGFRNDGKAIETIKERAKNYKPGSKEMKDLADEVEKRTADLQLHMNSAKREFTDRQSAILNAVYREITEETTRYCQTHGIAVVLRYNGEPIDVTNPQSVQAGIMKATVYVAPNVDITQPVLTALNGGGTTAGGGTANNTVTPTPPPRR